MSFDVTEILSSNLCLALLAVALLSSLYLIVFYRGRIRSVSFTSESADESVSEHELPSSELPSISIIVYDKESSTALKSLLNDIFAQKYTGKMEVIVASDGHSMLSSDVVNAMSETHRNLRLTFVPEEAHALSRKKLALTLGIKAAHYDYVLLTQSECSIPSTSWLKEFGGKIAQGHNLVIGHTYGIDSHGKKLKPMARFDSLADVVTYLSSATKGRPYRGDASNIAFSRKLFFDNRGFNESVGYHHGEDDIFVSRIAQSANPSLLLTKSTILPIKIYNLKQHHALQKMRHSFTGKFVSHGARRFFGSCSLMMWTWLASTVALALLSYPNLLPLTVALAFGIAWIIVAVSAWRKASRVLSLPINLWLLPTTMMLRPIYNFFYRLKSRSFNERNYTWSKP